MFPMFIPFLNYLWSMYEYLSKLMSHRTGSETHCISQRPLLPVTCSRLSFSILFRDGERDWMLGSQSHGQLNPSKENCLLWLFSRREEQDLCQVSLLWSGNEGYGVGSRQALNQTIKEVCPLGA